MILTSIRVGMLSGPCHPALTESSGSASGDCLMEVASLESRYGLAEGHKLLCEGKSGAVPPCSAQPTLRAAGRAAERAEAFPHEDGGSWLGGSWSLRAAGRSKERRGGYGGGQGRTGALPAPRWHSGLQNCSRLSSRLFATAQPVPSGTVKCLPCPSSQQKQQLNLY